MDREKAKLYCSSFITWMKGGFKENNKLLVQVLDFEKYHKELVESYEAEIASLKRKLYKQSKK